jgi:hypothetical protein
MKHILFLLSLFSTLAAVAQEVTMIQIRTLCFERNSSGIDKLAVVKPDQSVIEIGFPESFPSAQEKVPVVEGKVLFHDPSNLTGSPVAVARIPSALKNVLVMFFPNPGAENETAYRTVVIDSSLKGIPEDGALVMNIFPSDVRIVIGEHRVFLTPGKRAGLARPKQRNDYNMAPVVFQAQVGNEWKTVAETLVRFPAEQQQFFVSYPDSRTLQLAFRSYQIGDY